MAFKNLFLSLAHSHIPWQGEVFRGGLSSESWFRKLSPTLHHAQSLSVFLWAAQYSSWVSEVAPLTMGHGRETVGSTSDTEGSGGSLGGEPEAWQTGMHLLLSQSHVLRQRVVKNMASATLAKCLNTRGMNSFLHFYKIEFLFLNYRSSSHRKKSKFKQQRKVKSVFSSPTS